MTLEELQEENSELREKVKDLQKSLEGYTHMLNMAGERERKIFRERKALLSALVLATEVE